jgi:hypothetical protein
MSHLGRIERLVPYPLRAARISLSLTLFPWWRPRFQWNCNLTDTAKRDGETIWYARWLWFQISYSRWV